MKKTFLSLTLAALLTSCVSNVPLIKNKATTAQPMRTGGPAPLLQQNKATTAQTMRTGGPVPLLQQNIVMKHADLQISLYPKTQSITGIATLSLTLKKKQKQLLLDLDSNFQIVSIKVNKQQLNEDRYSNPEGQLLINLPTSVMGEIQVEIAYDGTPHVAKRAPWYGGFVWEKTDSGQDWIATAVQGDGCDLIWPCIDMPMGEPEKVDMHIDVPKGLVVAANGVFKGQVTLNKDSEQQREVFHWQTLSQHNTYAISLNVGPYALLQDTYKSIYGNDIDLQFYFLPSNEVKAEELFNEFPALLDFFEQVIGPYPFGTEKMGAVETPHLGMEHQTINAYGNGYKKRPSGYDWLLQHEFAHEWFGNQMTNVDWDDMWLHESFGTYMQPLYAQYLQGDMAYMADLFRRRQSIQNKFSMVSGESKAENEVYDSKIGPGGDIYAKGALVLHTLRQLIGDKFFFDSIRQLVYGTLTPVPGNFKPIYASTQDYVKIVNEITGRDYTWFFNVYLYQAALPVLDVHRTKDHVRLAWQVENNLQFRMPLEVSINGKIKRLSMLGEQTLTISDKDVVIIDPASKVLRDDVAINEYQSYLRDLAEKWTSK